MFSQQIKVNQIGFYPENEKYAIIPYGKGGYEILDENGKKATYGLVRPLEFWKPSEDSVGVIKFNQLKKEGTYTIKVGNKTSYSFSIKNNIYQDLLKASVKAFYFNRCSYEITPEFGDKWARPAGHPDTQVLVHISAADEKRPEGTVISSPKGWYDAGDYNKYIVNSGISTYSMLMAYEHFSPYFNTLNLNIPESKNTIPDLLDEILWNLEWMLTMQDPNDGGVYHKLTNKNFDGYVMPKDATEARYVVQKTTSAALNYCAVMSYASRILKAYEKEHPGLADKCLKSAVSAWEWAQKNPKIFYNQPKDVSTGQYEDSFVGDELFWAGAELYISTGNESYLTNTGFENFNSTVPNWQDTRTMGWIALANNDDKVNASYSKLAKDKILNTCEPLVISSQSGAYRTAMGHQINDFNWGSNGIAANQAMLLLVAHRFSKNKRYLNAAKSNLDYMLGQNATDYCFMTGFGTKSTLHPHHRPSYSDGVEAPVPGFLAGGPQPAQQDKCDGYPSKKHALSYLDSMCSYSTNEVAINWNAPLVYVLGAIEYNHSLKKKK